MSKVVKIPTSKGFESIVNVEDAPIVENFRWHDIPSHNGKHYARALISKPGMPRRFTMMHRLILNYHGTVDHINGNGLDNRRVNLRKAESAQNSWNRGPTSTNTSGFKGVCFTQDRFAVQIKAARKTYYLGRFKTAEEAAKAYDVAARKLHGEFAKLNFP